MPQEFSRKLAAIMFTDIFGFTSLMEKDEADAVTKQSRYKAVLAQCHQKYNGEIIKDMGDGSLSVFANSVDAVWCAIDIQLALRKGEEIPVRIGIHSGNVLFQQGDVLGDAVNVASRIESFAMPGSVFISDKVHDEIKNQQSIETILMGTFELKNVHVPMEIYALGNTGLIVPKQHDLHGKGIRTSRKTLSGKESGRNCHFRGSRGRDVLSIENLHRKGADSSQSKTIGIIPFVNLSTLKDDEYFPMACVMRYKRNSRK